MLLKILIRILFLPVHKKEDAPCIKFIIFPFQMFLYMLMIWQEHIMFQILI